MEIPSQNSSFPELSSFFDENLLLKYVAGFPTKQLFHVKDRCNIYANNKISIF